MKIGITSDLHLEFRPFLIDNPGDVDTLILAGDVCVAEHIERFPFYDDRNRGTGSVREEHSDVYLKFFEHVALQFDNIIVVAGNHEHYNGRTYKTVPTLRENLARVSDRFVVLDQDTVDIDGVRFIGGTMWTDFNGDDPLTEYHVGSNMNDFHIITHRHEIPNSEPIYRKFRPTDAKGIFYKTVDYFRVVMESDRDVPVVVVSHHAPSFKSVHDNYSHDHLMNGGYVSDLEHLMYRFENLKLWVHGHVHSPFDYVVGDNTRVVCNPRGYPNELASLGMPPFSLKVVEV